MWRREPPDSTIFRIFAAMENKTRILFVCLGNICRSPAAEGILRSMAQRRGVSDRFTVDSAGTYGGHAGDLPDPRMRRAAAARGYDLTHRARRSARRTSNASTPWWSWTT